MYLDGGEAVLVLADLQQGDIKSAAAQVEDEDELVLLALVQAVGQSRGGGLVDDAISLYPAIIILIAWIEYISVNGVAFGERKDSIAWISASIELVTKNLKGSPVTGSGISTASSA